MGADRHLKEEDKGWEECGEGGEQAHCVAPGICC